MGVAGICTRLCWFCFLTFGRWRSHDSCRWGHIPSLTSFVTLLLRVSLDLLVLCVLALGIGALVKWGFFYFLFFATGRDCGKNTCQVWGDFNLCLVWLAAELRLGKWRLEMPEKKNSITDTPRFFFAGFIWLFPPPLSIFSHNPPTSQTTTTPTSKSVSPL